MKDIQSLFDRTATYLDSSAAIVNLICDVQNCAHRNFAFENIKMREAWRYLEHKRRR